MGPLYWGSFCTRIVHGPRAHLSRTTWCCSEGLRRPENLHCCKALSLCACQSDQDLTSLQYLQKFKSSQVVIRILLSLTFCCDVSTTTLQKIFELSNRASQELPSSARDASCRWVIAPITLCMGLIDCIWHQTHGHVIALSSRTSLTPILYWECHWWTLALPATYRQKQRRL